MRLPRCRLHFGKGHRNDDPEAPGGHQTKDQVADET
jgi:hypothetical protein